MAGRWYVVPAVVAVLAGTILSGCSDAGQVSEPETKPTETVSEKTASAEPASEETPEAEAESTTASFKEAVTYKDGLKVEVSKIKHDVIGKYASGGNTGEGKTIFTVRITNGGETPFDVTGVLPSVTYGEEGTSAELVYDDDPVSDGFKGTLLPGKAMSSEWAFAVPKDKRGDVMLQVELAIFGEKEPAIFSGSTL